MENLKNCVKQRNFATLWKRNLPKNPFSKVLFLVFYRPGVNFTGQENLKKFRGTKRKKVPNGMGSYEDLSGIMSS